MIIYIYIYIYIYIKNNENLLSQYKYIVQCLFIATQKIHKKNIHQISNVPNNKSSTDNGFICKSKDNNRTDLSIVFVLFLVDI